MTTPMQEARTAVQQARRALSAGDRRLARQLAERAAKLAPELEDPWLVLAAVAGPRQGLEYIQRALQIDPESLRARRGLQWILQNLQTPDGQLSDTQKTRAVALSSTQPRPRVSRTKAVKPARRRPRLLVPLALLLLGCMLLTFAGWTAITSPVVASMLPQALLTAEPTQAAQWALADIPKPTYTAPAPVAEVLPTATPTAPPIAAATEAGDAQNDAAAEPTTYFSADAATAEPTQMVVEAATPTEEEPWTGTLSMDYVADTPTPEAPPYVAPTAAAPNPGGVTGGTHWIDVDLSQQMVYAYAGDTVVNSFVVSTGTWMTPTVTGKYKIWIKLRYSDMSGPDYYLPNVPYVMYFYKGYGLHGTYWHNNFGTPMSHGCVNLSIPDAEWLYNFSYEGTVVNVHY
jgi:lipoprotein-anchoring transpeptidase ErfK/SrfK